MAKSFRPTCGVIVYHGLRKRGKLVILSRASVCLYPLVVVTIYNKGCLYVAPIIEQLISPTLSKLFRFVILSSTITPGLTRPFHLAQTTSFQTDGDC